MNVLMSLVVVVVVIIVVPFMLSVPEPLVVLALPGALAERIRGAFT